MKDSGLNVNNLHSQHLKRLTGGTLQEWGTTQSTVVFVLKSEQKELGVYGMCDACDGEGEIWFNDDN